MLKRLKHPVSRMSEEDAAKYEHMLEKSAENGEKLKVSMIGHLSTLNDGVIAIFITVMMLEIPFPKSRAQYHNFIWAIMVFFVSFFIIAGFWYENKKIFVAMREADHLTVVVNFINLAVLALIPVTTKWIMNSVTRYAAINFGIVYYLTMLTQEWLRYATLRKRFVNHRGLVMKLASSRMALMTALVVALLALSYYSPTAAIILYVILPILNFVVPDQRPKIRK